MFQFTDSGAHMPSNFDAAQPQREPIRPLLFGSLAAVQLSGSINYIGYPKGVRMKHLYLDLGQSSSVLI